MRTFHNHKLARHNPISDGLLMFSYPVILKQNFSHNWLQFPILGLREIKMNYIVTFLLSLVKKSFSTII